MYRGPPHPRVQSRFQNVVFRGQDANVTMRVYLFQSEVDFAEATPPEN